MVDGDELNKLIRYIEENLRASRTAGLKFVDPRNFRQRLLSKQNHLIYGRRGAGKSTLLSSAEGDEHVVVIQLNLEDHKDITFPNIIIHVLNATLDRLAGHIRGPRLSAYRFRRKLRRQTGQLQKLLYEPDSGEQHVKTKRVRERGRKAQARLQAGTERVTTGVAASVGEQTACEEEVSRAIPVDKLDRLRTDLPSFKGLFQEASGLVNHTPIFLVLDDFYFIPKSTQPDFIDYFHRISKDTELYLKIATIKHRSRMYKQTAESFVGVEPQHDVYVIDMDYTLDNFGDLQIFMQQLLENAREASQADLQVDRLFSGGGFVQLCLASGGVPRDFLALFVKLASQVATGALRSIGKVDVTAAAITNRNDKLTSMKTDSAEEKGILEEYLRSIKEYVYDNKRTNAFLVAKPELEEYPQERQAIKELVDLRLFHLVDSNTSCAPSDGRRYEAYILDLGLYDNSRPRNFNQIEPGATDAKSRQDRLRAAPRLCLPDLRASIQLKNIAQTLTPTPD